jgi:hypothetical protein
MSELRQLPIDIDELAEAMDVGTRDTIDFFLDTQTGELVVTGDGCDEEIDVEDDDRYEPVPARDTAENYDLMREFIATLDDRRFAERLSHAITGSGAFGRFKRELANRPEAEADWYKFRSDALRRDAIEWLSSIGLQSTRVDRKSDT